MRRNPWWRLRVVRSGWRSKVGLVVGVVLVGVAAASAAGSPSGVRRAAPVPQTAAGPSRATRGTVHTEEAGARVAHLHAGKPLTLKPHPLLLTRASGPVFDVRKLKGAVVKRERPEHEDPFGPPEASAGSAPPSKLSPRGIAAGAAAAPGPDSSFDGLDFATWGAGHPPDENGDVGPNYYIQVVNTSIGIYDKSNGNRVAAFTFNAFMSQGKFGNLCDTDNFGDPVVLYDSFENRWFITDFAFQLDGSGNVVNPPGAFQCFAVSKTGDPVTGGWNFYSIAAPGALNDYPKFGVWPDGIYMSANMFGYPASGSYQGYHVWALNKQQMYAGAPAVQVVDFSGDASDFTVIPANARLQAGTPPTGSSEYFVSTEQFLNALSIYKFQVDWDKPSTSTFAGPFTQLQPNCWPNATPGNAATPANAADVLPIRAMAQAQYTNIGGAESLWVDHTVQRGVSATNTTCNATTGGNATVRWYQANVTGGTVAANVVQGSSFDPEGANTFFRFMPSLAVDRMGDMAIGYTKSNSTTNPQVKYAGRLGGDPTNTLGQTEQTLINGTGAQSGNCGSSACIRWGDYSGMALDPNGCKFWMTGEYYATSGLNDLTRIGSFHYPGCTPVGNGTLSGTVTDGANPIAGATISLGSRTTTTDGSGNYSFTVPAGTYASLTAAKDGFDPASASTIVVPDSGTATKNLTLNAAAQSGCFTDNSQASFQRGTPSKCDLVSSPGSVVLAAPDNSDAQNSTVSPTGFGISNTSWAGQTFTPTVTGQIKRVDVELFCSACTANSPNVTLSIRNTTGATPVPTGADLATASLPGFNDGGAGGLKTFTFASPITLTAGTRYAFVFRLASAFASGTIAYTCSCKTTGYSNTNPYANGQFVTSTNTGSTWAADTTVGGRDLNFVTYINPGYTSSGTFVSSLKDANPKPGSTPDWTTLSWTASTPAGTSVKFQIAASNSQYGPFNFVGPDGTANTFFTTSGASLNQFDGMRYVKYEAFQSTNSSSVTPSLSTVSVCFNDTSSATATTLVVAPASGTFGGSTNLSATLTKNGTAVANEPVAFTLNGTNVGSTQTNSSGVATLPGVSLNGIAAGAYSTGVGASFAGDTGLDPSTGSGALTVSKANQAITVTTPAPASAVFNSQFTVAAAGGGSGNPVTFSSSGSCSNSGATFTMTSGTGTCTVLYDQAGSANYNAGTEVTESVNASKANQTIAINTHAPSSAAYGSQFTVAASALGGPVSYSSGGSCSNGGATFTLTSGTGTCTVLYDQAGSANYNAGTEVTESVTATKAIQAITVTTPAPASAVFKSQFTVAASGGGSGNPVTFSSGGGCSNSGATFTMTSGTTACQVKYDQAGSANYNAAPQIVESVTAQKASQAIAVTTHAPASAVFNSQFTVAATGGGSGDAVTFSSSGSCSNSGATFTMTSGTGTCTVMYDQAGNSNYNAAPEVTETVNASKANQTITITTHAPSTAVYGTSFKVAASGAGGLVTFSSGGVCLNIGDTFTMMSGTGTCTVKYDQAGSANYNAASEVTEPVNAQKADQTITVTTHAPANAGDGSSFDVAANAPGGPVSYSSGGSCSNSGATFTMTSASGTCAVKYDQAGSANYNAATEVNESVTAGKVDQSISVTTHAPSSAVYGSQFTVAANAPGGTVAYSSGGSCSSNGATFTMTSASGICSVTYDQAGNGTYNAAPEVIESVNASQADQSISVTTHGPSSAVFGSQFTVAASAPGGAVAYSSGGSCSNSGATFTMTSGTGTCTVKYDQAGNGNYNAAPQVTDAVNAGKVNQSVSVTTHAPSSAVYGSQFAVAATAPGGPVTYSSGGSCSNSGATFTLTSATGTCMVKYDQAGGSNHNAAPELTETVSAAAAFGGFQAPLPNAALKAVSKTTVKFTLTDASGQPLSATAAAALAVQVILSGPNGSAAQLASAPCTWVTTGQLFQCDLKAPSGLKTGASNPYRLTARQNVGGQYVLAPPYTSAASDANPETIFFQGSAAPLPKITVSTRVGKRKPRHGRFLQAQISLAGRMSPANAGEVLRFTIQRRNHGAWRTVSRASRPLNKHDAAKISVKTAHTGRYRARASFAGDTNHASARSGWTRFHVR